MISTHTSGSNLSTNDEITYNIKSEDEELEIYNSGELATVDDVKFAIDAIKSICTMDEDFFKIFAITIKNENITKRRLQKGLMHFLTNHRYKTCTIADILNYNPKVRFYTPEEIAFNENGFPNPKYWLVSIPTTNGEIRKLVKKEDAIEHNLDVINDYKSITTENSEKKKQEEYENQLKNIEIICGKIEGTYAISNHYRIKVDIYKLIYHWCKQSNISISNNISETDKHKILFWYKYIIDNKEQYIKEKNL